jgi:4-alpha-glucanotransferase
MTALERLAERLGVFREYHELDGAHRVAPRETLAACIAAMGVPAGSEAEAAEALAALEAEDAARRMPREDAVAAGVEGAWFGPHDRAWRLALEDGGRIDGPPGAPLPALPQGLHRLEAEDGEAVTLVAAPPHAPSVAEVSGRGRIWGVTAALYGLVAPRSLGRGDYEDLAVAAETLAARGADFLGINPVHDRGAAHRGLSPYSPSSRSAFDAGHLAIEKVPEFGYCSAAQTLLAEAGAERVAASGAEFGDSALRARVAEPALRALFATFETTGQRTGRGPAFEAWLEAGGVPRHRQAVFEALSLRHGEDWRRWPVALRDPEGPEVAAFEAAEAPELRYHAWLQWLAEAQIGEAQARARGAGMALGLYLDIAVGVRPGGGEVWARGDAFACGVSLGAPPDMMNAQGQEWGLAPFSPEGLRRADYEPFRAMLRAAMDRAGAVRIDHVLGVERAFWVPEGGDLPGTYVRQPGRMLEALIRLEAARSGTVVVGEDLGTVPEGFRARMAAQGIHGCAVLQFEGGAEGFRDPATWAAPTLAAFGTHDTPTLAGWWEAEDVAIRETLGHLDAAGAAAARAERGRERVALAHRLATAGLLPAGIDPEAPPERLSPGLRDAVHGLIGASGSAMAAVQLDDALGERTQQNVPGTVEEAPNWRRRHRVPPGELDRDPDVAAAAAAVSQTRGGGG